MLFDRNGSRSEKDVFEKELKKMREENNLLKKERDRFSTNNSTIKKKLWSYVKPETDCRKPMTV